MKFVVLNYGMDIRCWDEGEEIGRMVDNYKETDHKKYTKVLKTSLNSRWYRTFTENDNDWPHPNRILLGLSKIAPDIQIDWMPEINYLGIYVDNEKVLDFLKDNFSYMLDTEATI